MKIMEQIVDFIVDFIDGTADENAKAQEDWDKAKRYRSVLVGKGEIR